MWVCHFSREEIIMKGFNVVLFWYMNDWGKYGRAYEKIAENLANQNNILRVLCILPPVRIQGVYRFYPFVSERISKKLIVLTPNRRVIPLRFAPGIIGEKANDFFFSFSVSCFMKLLSFTEDNTMLWVFPPHSYINYLRVLIPHKVFITQFVDSNIYKEDDPPEKIAFAKNQYEELARDSDIVITSSKLNFDYFSPMNPNCYLFENAVDPAFIADPSAFPYLVNGRRPRLGYTGYISERTDIDLLEHIAKMRPDYDLILAGPVEIPQTEFKKLKLANVHYEGIIPYGKMPAFLRSLDICLIPHRDTQFSRSMSPLKLFQYLASGRPIVSTKVAGVERWDRFISIAENHEDFIVKIDETIKIDTIEKSSKRVEAAKVETWDRRVKEMVDTISGLIRN